MTDDKFGKQCPVCNKRIPPEFLARHLGIKHPTFDDRQLVRRPLPEEPRAGVRLRRQEEGEEMTEIRVPLGGTIPVDLGPGDSLKVEGNELVITKAEKPQPVKLDYTTEELLALCEEAAAVPMKHWHNRDSYAAIKQVGECWALLKAGVPYRILTDDPATNEDTIWIEHYNIEGFQYHEYGDAEDLEIELSYLPTRKRLDEVKGKEWY